MSAMRPYYRSRNAASQTFARKRVPCACRYQLAGMGYTLPRTCPGTFADRGISIVGIPYEFLVMTVG